MNVPQLRFSGFDGEWEKIALGKITNTFSGGTPDSKNPNYYSGTIPFIRSGEINSNSTALFINEAGLKNSSAKMVCKGDLLIALYGATSGEIGISKIDGAINQAVLCLRTEHSKVFLMNMWKRHKENIILTYLQGGQGNLSGSIVKNVEFYLPQKEEQEKIAKFFSILDKKIEKQQEKIEMLEQFKKGMMQKIFSQELRFKDEDGGEFSQWEEKKLGQVLKIKHGRDQKKIETPNGRFPILATGGIIGRTDTFIYNKESVLIGRKGTIDRPVYMDSPFWTVDTLFYSEIVIGNYPKFIFYIFQNINWKLYNEASGVPSLSAKTIEAIKVMVPIFKEQKVVADYLSVIDKKIEKEKEKLMVLEEQKKGFMQGMFV